MVGAERGEEGAERGAGVGGGVVEQLLAGAAVAHDVERAGAGAGRDRRVVLVGGDGADEVAHLRRQGEMSNAVSGQNGYEARSRGASRSLPDGSVPPSCRSWWRTCRPARRRRHWFWDIFASICTGCQLQFFTVFEPMHFRLVYSAMCRNLGVMDH